MSSFYEAKLSAFQDEVWSSLEKYGRKLGWGLSGNQPENWIFLDHAVDELVNLRELLRWRKWPEEKPDTNGDYYVCWDDECAIGIFDMKIGWLTGEPFHWRPIGPLPGGE